MRPHCDPSTLTLVFAIPHIVEPQETHVKAGTFYTASNQYSPAVNLIVFLVGVLNVIHHLSFPATRLILKVMKVIIRLLFAETESGSPPPHIERLIASIPTDPTTARDRLHLDPVYTVYACCPSCFALQPPRPSSTTTRDEPTLPPDLVGILPNYLPASAPQNKSDKAQYPEECPYRSTLTGTPCNAKLLRHGPTSRPIRSYSHQSLVSWLARMLLRPEIERYLDASQENARSSPSSLVEDILQSQAILSFLGPDGLPFLRTCGTEGRYIFSLFVDWFNPRGNKHGGATYSVGVVFMVCLNLPPTLRYKRENVYLAGVIPGPKAPSLEQVNHILEPLTQELGVLWTRGAHFSRTALRPNGRTARCAAFPLICDLGAGRKISGQASHSSSFFCSFCQLLKISINDLDSATWPRRDCATFRHLAEEWRTASTERERERLFKASGIRYSSLLDLPYWQPTRYTIIDTMHNLFLGILQRHCRRIFGMDVTVPSEHFNDDGDTPAPITPEELSVAQTRAATSKKASSLKRKLNLRLLQAVYEANGLGSPGTLRKQELAEAIFNVRRYVYDVCIYI